MAKESSEVFTFKPFVFSRVVPISGNGSKVPKARSGHRIVCDNGNIYSFGGFNPRVGQNDPDMADDPFWEECRPLFRELWKYNFASRMWTKLTGQGAVPQEPASHTSQLKGSTLLVYGGTGVPFGSTSSNELHLCNLRQVEWRTVAATGNLPEQQYGQAVAMDDDYFYTVGGTTGFEYSIDVHRLDLKSCSWEALYISNGDSGEPEKRYRHEVGFDGTNIYVLGGGTMTQSFGFENVPIFNVAKLSWKYLPTLPDPERSNKTGIPEPRRCHGCVQLDSDVFISGGYNGNVIFDDIWRLNLNTLQWTLIIKCMPKPVYFHATSLTPSGCMYIFGGVTHIQQNQRTNSLYKIWLRIPSLKEICWESLLHHQPRLSKISRQSLLEIGMPLEYVNRIEHQAVCG